MAQNSKISILVSSREKGRKNPGNLIIFLTTLKLSLYNVNNVEVIFKFDKDDNLILKELKKAQKINPEIKIKYLFSKRYGYLGLHKAYYDCLPLVDNKAYIIVTIADDFIFTPNNHWDKIILNNSFHLKNEPFIIQDKSKKGKHHDVPVFSKKFIDLVSLGNSLSTDDWSVRMYNIYSELKLYKYIIDLPEFARRLTSSYDWGKERWKGEREQLIKYLESKEYQELINKSKNKIKEYFNK